MDKPYDFIPLLGKKDYREGGETFSGKIILRVTTLTPLYIMRAEIWKAENEKLIKRFYSVNNEYIIPGSTLKGVVRTVAQSVSYSCINTSQSRELIKNESKINDRCNCMVCRTFGRMSYKSKVTFKDLKLKNKEGKMFVRYIPKLMKPHPEKEFYKDGEIFRGIKFYHHGVNEIVESGEIPVEAVKSDSFFEGEVCFEKLDINQLKLLCFSLGLDGSVQLKLGYDKPGYFGSCKVEVLKAQKIIDSCKLNSSYEEFDASLLASQWGENDNYIHKNIVKLREILSYSNAKKVSEWTVESKGMRSY